MEVDGETREITPEEDIPTCAYDVILTFTPACSQNFTSDSSIEAPPSVLPQRRYCDITGLEVYTPPSQHTSITSPDDTLLRRVPIQTPRRDFDITTKAYMS